MVPVLPVITPGAFPDQYRALGLSHKLFPLINAFNLESQDVAWFFQNNNALGWFEWDSIPYEAGQVAINYTSYIAFATIIDLLKQLSPVASPAGAEQPISFFTIAARLLPASVRYQRSIPGSILLTHRLCQRRVGCDRCLVVPGI